MTVFCNCENCEYYEDGLCYAEKLNIEEGGVCMTMREIIVEDEENDT